MFFWAGGECKPVKFALNFTLYGMRWIEVERKRQGDVSMWCNEIKDKRNMEKKMNMQIDFRKQRKKLERDCCGDKPTRPSSIPPSTTSV